ncbi:hypothetical protein N0V83_008044 [Neocucurbitaria cava]|uniref:Uncharacterized protein n=1 Tax=Neocucurbitaria cava TaxID=798079 RepID=A0A9W8Y2U7_9PLEO|nr:hypothetical protein N0V83_008044 [Neocucurbitaria cava]
MDEPQSRSAAAGLSLGATGTLAIKGGTADWPRCKTNPLNLFLMFMTSFHGQDGGERHLRMTKSLFKLVDSAFHGLKGKRTYMKGHVKTGGPIEEAWYVDDRWRLVRIQRMGEKGVGE